MRVLALLLLTTACGRVGFGTDGPPIDSPPPDRAVLVQQVTSVGLGTSLSATLPAPPLDGSVLVMIGAIQSGALTSTVGGATWQLAVRETTNANVEVWYGIPDRTDTAVTIAGTVSSDMWMSLQEWRGVDTTAPLDASSAMFGSTSPATAGTIECGAAGDLVVFAVSNMLPNTFGTPTGADWIALEPPTSATYVEQPWYTLGEPGARFAPTVTETGGNWGAAIAAFRLLIP